MRIPRTRACIAAAAFLAVGAAAATPRGRSKPLPPASENKGRAGTYQCRTSHQGYNYYLYVPPSYSEEKPAGLHLFFHGQAGQSSAEHFGSWKGTFLEPHNLIGINMQYTDGNNSSDTGGKVDAAVEAIRQTMADYKIIAGRGAVGSFSGGGLPHAQLFAKFQRGKSGYEGIRWPFNHSSLYGSNYWENPSGGCPMSWYIGVGTEEWDMGTPTLGTSSTGRAEDLYGAVVRQGYCPDVYLKITKGKGHSISREDARAAAEQFARSEVVLAPFIYEPDYVERELKPVVAYANHGMLAQAVRKLEAVLRRRSLSDEVRGKAEALKERLEARIEKLVGFSVGLLETDPILGLYYGKRIAKQLSGLPEGRKLTKDLRAALRSNRKNVATYNLLGFFAKGIGGFFEAGGRLKAMSVPLLENVKMVAGERVLIGRMAGEFLQLR